MKNFKIINQSLWAGSSPNQTGETLTRENRIGVKSWLNRGLMLLITLLTLGVGQMWATQSFDDVYMDWYFNDVQFYTINGNAAYHYSSSDDRGNGVLYDLGVLTTTFKIKSIYWKVSAPDWNPTYCNGWMKYKINGGDIQSMNYNSDIGQGSNQQIGGDFNPNHEVASYNGTPGEYYFEHWFETYIGYSDGYHYFTISNTNGTNYRFKYIIPGFSATSGTVNFGTQTPEGAESETFGVYHYGDMGSYSITGANADEFEMRIDGNSVKVIFKPKSAGAKSATLTMSDTYGNPNSSCSLTLQGTAAAKGVTTRLYFNNYNYNSNWTYGSASSRFTVEYTSGVYTYFPMTQCANSSYNYYADVEIKEKTVSVDRYNASTHEYYNTASVTGINASNPYAVLDNLSGGIFYGFATNHPYNDVSGGNIYYDNLESGLTNTIYLVVGHDYKMADGGGDKEYSKGYALGNIPNTKLYYGTFADTWHDADYYAFIGASSAPSAGEWGSNDLSSKASSSSYTGIFREVMDLESGSSYLGLAPSKTGGALSMTKSPTLNTTQTFNYALSTDGGSSYPALTSGVNTPGKLSMASFEFTNEGCTAVVAKSAQELAASATTYTKAVSNVAYTGTTVLTESNTRDGYSFIGWYEGNTLLTASAGEKSYTYYPRENKTYTARYKAHRYNIAFNRNDEEYTGTIASGTMDPISNVVYDQNQTLTANNFKREGYTFAGWTTSPDGSGDSYDDAAVVSNLTPTDGATITLYAQWTDNHLYYYNGASADGWRTASNWTRNAVPGTGDDVILLTDVEVPSGTTTVNSVRIATSGNYTPVGGDEITADASLTIPAGRMLVVTQDVKNCTISDNAPTTGTATTSGTLIILGATTGNGALIWGTTGTPGEATVEFVTISGGKPGSSAAVNQYIGIPFTSMNSYAYSTASYSAWVFEVSGGAWSEIHGETMSPWKGYNLIAQYGKDDVVPSSTSYYLSGELVSNAGGSITGVSAGSETLYANSWVAPILIKNIESEKFTYTDANIYIFNSASEDGIIAPTGSQHAAMGNYTTYPVNQSGSAVIPSMQSFSTWGSGTLTLVYNDVVNYSGVSHSTIAPNRAPKYDYREAIWATQDTVTLNVSSASGWADELKIYIHEDFSDDFESGWDGRKMEGSWEAPQLYAATGFGQMAVNCVKTIDNSVIGFHAGTAANEYSMTIKYSGEDELYLRDTKTGVETPITEETKYEFTSDSKDSDMRFVIKKAPKIVTGMEELGTNSNVQKFLHNGTLYIIRDGRIYNAEGSLVK